MVAVADIAAGSHLVMVVRAADKQVEVQSALDTAAGLAAQRAGLGSLARPLGLGWPSKFGRLTAGFRL